MSKELMTLASAIRVAAMQLQVSCEEVMNRLGPVDKNANAAAPASGKGKAAPAGKGKGKAAPVEEETEEVESPFKDTPAEETEGDDDDLFGDDAADAAPAEPTIDDIRKVVKDFCAKHGKEKGLKLLGKFKAASIPDVKKGDYQKLIDLAKKHL